MARANLTKRRAAREGYEEAAKEHAPGEKGGARFKALSKSAEAGGATSGNKVAGSIFWKKYGKKGGSEILKKAR